VHRVDRDQTPSFVRHEEKFLIQILPIWKRINFNRFA